MTTRTSYRRRWLVPEVVQTSAMDCGPAVLKCLLAGYGIGIHYGRLREACQTDLDGTSVDTLEEAACQLGLDAEQVMLPVDHVLMPELKTLPAILIIRLPDGATHFVLVWRRHGPLVQVMDPAVGRRWITCRQLMEEMYVHRQVVPAEAWRQWAVSEEMAEPMRRRLSRLGMGAEAADLMESARDAPSWESIAQLDAVVRFVESLVGSGALARGKPARQTVLSLIKRVGQQDAANSIIPPRFWSVSPVAHSRLDDTETQASVQVRGAVLVRIVGRKASTVPLEPGDTESNGNDSDSQNTSSHEQSKSMGVELRAALCNPTSRPLSKLWEFIRQAGYLSLSALLILLCLAAAGAVAESLLLRGVLDLRRDLATKPQRILAITGICLFGLAMIALEYLIGTSSYRMGRLLENTFRVRFLAKIPKLHDRYFQSRPTSDMAERGHSLHRMRLVPRSAGQLLRASATIALTALAIAWLEPTAGALAFLAALIAVMLPILFVPVLQGLDLRVRTHVGALTRFSFDALLGIAPVRAHVAQSSIGVEHEGLLVEWAAASYRLLRWRVLVDGLQMVIGISMAAWILLTHASHATDATGVLLLAYWALNIPALGDEIASLVHQYPSYRNITLRLLEPLGTPEQVPVASGSHEGRSERVDSPIGSCRQGDRSAAAVELKNVTVRAGGHTILDSLDLELPAHSHVAIVGPSGAGKSSLVGLLLGWHRATSGQVFVDGKVLDADRLTELRSGTVWIDPSVQLWNRSMLENLLYGNAESNFDLVSDAVHQADLYDVLQRLPDGLQMRLGESGGLLSGGEGQRIRFGRGLARGVPRLVIMDEPFRGLERSRRHELLQRATSRWKDATLIFITHDVGETLEFPRVLVIDCGRLVEDAAPDQLRERPGSLYRSLLDAEVAVRDGLWASKLWRRTKLRSGSLRDVKEEPSS